MAANTLKTAVLENPGPIKRLEIPITPGVIVLRGRNGTGKSTAIDAMRMTLGGVVDHPPTPRDSTDRWAVQLGQARLVVGLKRTARRGRLTVTTLDDKVNIARLVDPGIKDPERADAARLRVLIHASGMLADPAIYGELIDGVISWDELEVDDNTDDPLVLAQRVKGSLERLARHAERLMEKLHAQAQLIAESEEEEEIDAIEEGGDRENELLSLHKQRKTIEKMIAEADAELVSMHSQMSVYKTRRAVVDEAKAKLAEIGTVDVTLKEAEMSEASDEHIKADELVRELQSELSAAIERRRQAEEKVARAVEALKEARDAKTREEFYQRAIEAALPPEVTNDQIVAKQSSIMELNGQRQRSIRAGELIETIKKFRALAGDAEDARGRAELFRELAGQVELVLTQRLPLGRLRLADGRIVLENPDRGGLELFSDLSRGERYREALQLVANQLPDGGLVTLDQEAWEGLDPENQSNVASHAASFGIAILTAEATDGELRVEQFQDAK